MILINDANDSRIVEFISIRDHVLNSKDLIVAESEKLFLQFRSSGKIIHKILATPAFIERYNLEGENIFGAEKKILESVAGFKIHFEILFLAEKPKDTKLDALDNRIILLNGLSSPENVGSIVRSSAAFGIKSIILDEKTCSPYLRRCIRVSMGNVFAMKTYHAINLRGDLKKLKDLGYAILSTANIPGSTDLANYTFPDKCVLIIGSEGHGVDQDIINFSDTILKINIDLQVAHLNASNAAAIFLSHMSTI
ncbi:MAG: RNA methyltransferase [Bacteriovorax sp.]|nr:RNA methyltransferase [Bacteriovorax sp.]